MFGGATYQIINNAIDTTAYTYDTNKRVELRRQLGLADELVIGHVGRFNPQKNHPFLMDIFAALLKKESNAVLLLVGGGEGMSKMQEKVQELGIAEHVRFLGVRSDVADLMQAMDVFVLPSLYEGLPVTMVEAQAAGLPCIISDKVPPECILTEVWWMSCLCPQAQALGQRRSLRSEPSPAPTVERKSPRTASISTQKQ